VIQPRAKDFEAGAVLGAGSGSDTTIKSGVRLGTPPSSAWWPAKAAMMLAKTCLAWREVGC